MAATAFESYSPRLPACPPEREIYDDRQDAGRVLARALARYRRRRTLLVLAISSAGVEVALPIARSLGAPLDLVMSSLLPIPQRPESSFGAVVEDAVVLNDGLVAGWELDPAGIERIVVDVRNQASHRMLQLRGDKPLPDVRGKTVIIADDGLAVGFPIVAAIEWVLKQNPRDIVVGIPVAPRHEIERLIPLVSAAICPIEKDTWNLSIAAFYRRWKVPTLKQVADYLRQGGTVPVK